MAEQRDDPRLSSYRAKRDHTTPEPSGAGAPEDDADGRFSIQHHWASSEHYDLRLGHDGVLLSWAIPKGPSTDPADKRLAIRTEDHPADYIHFEGTIPEDAYGGGSVIVWDSGAWRNATSDDTTVGDALQRGHLRIEVEGEKLFGGYVLQHIDGPLQITAGEQSQWLFIKTDDHGADARRNPTSTQPESVLTGRTVTDVAAQAGVADTNGSGGNGGDSDTETGDHG